MPKRFQPGLSAFRNLGGDHCELKMHHNMPKGYLSLSEKLRSDDFKKISKPEVTIEEIHRATTSSPDDRDSCSVLKEQAVLKILDKRRLELNQQIQAAQEEAEINSGCAYLACSTSSADQDQCKMCRQCSMQYKDIQGSHQWYNRH